MNPVSSALSIGYTAVQILNFLSKKNPSLAGKIGRATSAGYTANQILNFISRDFKSQDLEGLSEQQIHKKRREYDAESTKDLAKIGLGIAGTLASRGMFGGQSPTQAPTQPSPVPPIPGTPPAQGMAPPIPPIGPAPMANAPVQPPAIPPVGPAAMGGIPTVTPNQPAQGGAPFSPPPQQAQSQLLKQLGVEELVKSLAAKGQAPEQISSQIQGSMHPGTRKSLATKIAQGVERPIAEHIKDYLKSPEGLLREDVLKFGEETPLQKGDLVLDPSSNTMGDVKDIKQKQALLDSDGKLHKAETDNLIKSPLPKKDLAELHDDLIRGIEEETGQQVSRNVNWAGYDPEKNMLAYLPHDGRLYTYEDMSEEDTDYLTKTLHQRKTSGSNFIGAWEQGSESPIGAAMYKLIKKLQEERGGKGNEYSGKFETIYSALEPAIKAAKAAKRKKR